MKMELIERGDKPVEWLRLKFKDANVGFINALRRTVIAHVPVLAIEDVAILNNTSALYDEILALRLGLIPLKADPKLYKDNKDFTASFVLKVKGPGTVYSKDLQPSNPDVVPAFDAIPIVKLTDWQEIELEAIAKVGTAEEHAKWQAGYAYYKELEDGSYEFYIESFGNMPVKDLLILALETLGNMVEETGKAMLDALPEKKAKKKASKKTKEKEKVEEKKKKAAKTTKKAAKKKSSSKKTTKKK